MSSKGLTPKSAKHQNSRKIIKSGSEMVKKYVPTKIGSHLLQIFIFAPSPPDDKIFAKKL